MHEAFYATVAQVSPILLVGAAYASRFDTWSTRIGVHLATVVLLPALVSLLLSLTVLAGIFGDTVGMRWVVILLVAVQVAVGAVGLAEQALSSKE